MAAASIRTLLIANRGEIACRIARTARRLGVRTVSLYTEHDATALHVEAADEAVAVASYLDIPGIVAAAARSGADAVHPGYGFLSENADFAEACASAGLVFVGPPAAAIRAMGSKTEAKRLMAAAGVPLVPGAGGGDMAESAARLGYPVLVKASAGGGGRGMRVVRDPSGLEAAVEGARREALAAFGDGSLLLERWLDHARHVEVQVFADTHGGAVTLFDRDCSVQRRHQKVVEEAPAPGLADSLRRSMAEAALAAVRAVGYVGAGTVEFLVEDGRFHFIEMNTRLQVEHPVTEMVTGLDLVEWQVRVASGEPLPPVPAEPLGHALEVRLYAEDPERGFLPSPGRLQHLRLPDGPGVRVDTGVRAGDEISRHYDPMIAKLVAWGSDRDGALARLRAALAATEAAGISTNLGLLSRIADHPAFAAGGVDTGFIERHHADLLPPPPPPPPEALAFAELARLQERGTEARRRALASGDPHSPWHLVTGWRLGGGGGSPGSWSVEAGGRTLALRHLHTDGPRLTVEMDGRRRRALVVRTGDTLTVQMDGQSWRIASPDPNAAALPAAAGRLVSPMPGTVVRVTAEPGLRVTAGQPLMVIEAMKMEHTVAAPADGTVTEIRFRAGDAVPEGAELMVFEED